MKELNTQLKIEEKKIDYDPEYIKLSPRAEKIINGVIVTFMMCALGKTVYDTFQPTIIYEAIITQVEDFAERDDDYKNRLREKLIKKEKN